MPTEKKRPAIDAMQAAVRSQQRPSAFDQHGAAQFLEQECGQRVAAKTLQKLRCIGGGPAFYRGYGRRCYYTEEALREWADAHRSPIVRSTSELPGCGRTTKGASERKSLVRTE